MPDKTAYVVLHGSMPHTDKSLVEYVAHIVYGNPRIDAIEVGKNFVALVEWSAAQETNAKYTFERMGSFSIGAQFMYDQDVALREFGIWVRHNAPGTIVGFEAA